LKTQNSANIFMSISIVYQLSDLASYVAKPEQGQWKSLTTSWRDLQLQKHRSLFTVPEI